MPNFHWLAAIKFKTETPGGLDLLKQEPLSQGWTFLKQTLVINFFCPYIAEWSKLSALTGCCAKLEVSSNNLFPMQ